ncbi:MAG TPA: hypothetical protein VFM69_01230 [Pricia sp.]|nr:hypothetical protein [Pricia sp.]
MKKLSEILGAVLTFITSTGFVWIGGIAAGLFVFLTMPKNWFWGVVFGIIVGIFVMKNLDKLRPWAVKQWKDLKGNF